MVLLQELSGLGEVRVLGLAAAGAPGDFLQRQRGVADELGIEQRARHPRALERLGHDLLAVDGEEDGTADIRVVEGRPLRVHEQHEDRVHRPAVDLDLVAARRRQLVGLCLAHRRPRVPQHDAARLGRRHLRRPADEDELLHAVEVGQAGHEVVLVLLPLDHRAAVVLLEPERAGADLGLGPVEVAVFLEHVLGRHAAPRRGDGGREVRHRILQRELHGGGVRRLDRGHQRLEGGAALRALEVGIEDAVERRLHVGGGEGLPVVPPHAAAQMERVRLAVGRGRPALREIAGDLGRIVGIPVQQPAVDARGGLLHDERRLRVHVEPAGIAVIEPVENAAVTRLVWLGVRFTDRGHRGQPAQGSGVAFMLELGGPEMAPQTPQGGRGNRQRDRHHERESLH